MCVLAISEGSEERLAVGEVLPIPAVATPAVAPVPEKVENEHVERQILALVLCEEERPDSRAVVEPGDAAARVPGGYTNSDMSVVG